MATSYELFYNKREESNRYSETRLVISLNTMVPICRVLIVLVVVVVVVVVAAKTDEQYCNICKTHTMCTFKGVGSNCAPKLGGGVDKKDQATILKIHNDLRQKVAQGKETIGAPGPQPPAANMRMLTWDDELAAVAQRWADQCIYDHNECNNVTRFPVGQNLGWVLGNSPVDWVATVEDWYSEVKAYNKDWIKTPVINEETGHYTQTVWADTALVGCGYIQYRNNEEKGVQHLYVCNYGPAGNNPDTPLYKVGTAASKCPAGTTSGAKNGYPGLCS